MNYKILHYNWDFVGFSFAKLPKVAKKNPDPEVKYQEALVYYGNKITQKAVTLLEDVSSFIKAQKRLKIFCIYYPAATLIKKIMFLQPIIIRFMFHLTLRGGHYEECLYMEAFCYYKESLIPKLDQKRLQQKE